MFISQASKQHRLKRYHSQTYVNGSKCDLNGNPRETEVRVRHLYSGDICMSHSLHGFLDFFKFHICLLLHTEIGSQHEYSSHLITNDES